MPKFVKLKTARTNSYIWINPDSITAIKYGNLAENYEGYEIEVVMDDYAVVVRETPEQILALIEGEGL